MLKLAGVIFVVLGSTGAGVTMAWSVRRTLETARRLRASLERMKNEIACRRTALPELMELLSGEGGPLSELFGRMAEQLRLRQEASVYAIVRKCLAASPPLPGEVNRILMELAPGLGQYDIQCQLYSLDLAAGQAQALIERCQSEQKGRVKSYCTLGVCAGLALAIMLL